MPIHVLSEQLASQIAAGEVVERPASVVKELVENALDAGAATINIEIRQGGRRLVQVADDGAGIPTDEVELAFHRHATSKLADIADLNAIATLGFRGEALAAIAAVSHLTLVTRSADDVAGTRLALEGGHLASRDLMGAPRGTVVAVENLFYNVPARLKFLKSVNTEKRQIDEFVTRYALAYPEVRFRLSHDNRITFQSPGSGSVLDVLLEIYGSEAARDMLPISEEAGAPNPERSVPIAVSGYVGAPSLHRANRTQITLFCNGRWIKDTRLTYAVIQAYHTLLPVGRFPVAALFITLPYDLVDVNVHPAKTEVRFRHPNAVFGALQRAVRETLVAGSPVRGFNQIGGGPWQRPGGIAEDQSFATVGSQLDLTFPRPQLYGTLALPGSDEHDMVSSEEQPVLGGEKLPIMRVVGQVGAAYIVAEGPDGMFLIDQHAAHERILYERFMAERERQGVVSQGLMTSAAVHVPPAQARLLEDSLPLLDELGFEIEPFGPSTYVVRAVPALLANQDPSRALQAVVEELEAEARPLEAEIEARLIRRVCKTAAVKAGQPLSSAEMQAMIQQLEACHNPHTCPHGRPTFIHVSLAQLAQGFERT
jgi:DNA mismatch repair protein MutL